MDTFPINMPSLFFADGALSGDSISKSSRLLGDLKGIFQDTAAFAAMNPMMPAYDVYSHLPVPEGTPGALYFGLTKLYPGCVGQEYFMTKGHFHHQADRTEYYWTIEGEGMLILMDAERKVWAERMFPGSLHHIAGGIAHRTVNTCHDTLSFGACWPADAGHNYGTIATDGFAARLMNVNGQPQLIAG